MQIIFSRHGNTFASGETAVWVGARQDLPLVDSGIQQAKNLASAIQAAGLPINAIYCGPLRRTSDYARIIVEELHSSLSPIIDTRLNEIDYGHWSGLSSTEIQEKGGGDELAAWENASEWPKTANWSSSSTSIANEVKAFAEDLVKKQDANDTVLVITSNGRLRYFLQLIPKAFQQAIQNKNFKVATGNLCLFAYGNAEWQMKFWNKKPDPILFI
jgi:broad specificity phosphatase PhoE